MCFCPARLAQKMAATHFTCTKHSNSTQCNADTANYCQWTDAIGEGVCVLNPESFLQELMFCPGSVMAQVTKCQADSQAACGGITGCKWMDVSSAAIRGAASKALSTNAGDDKSTSLAGGVCWPANVPATSMREMWEFRASLFGTCAGVDVFKRITGVQVHCTTLNETSCKADKLCSWDSLAAGTSDAGMCDIAPTGIAELLFTTMGTAAFNEAVAKSFADCRAAQNETQCAAVGTTQIQESKVAAALAFEQGAAAKNAAAGAGPLLHVVMGALSLGALLVLGA
ncbi:hypothetical protein COO60DRAFT_1699372 [Scenedesmus sp. NREL 46B-D3]|nr:hypothetical protein COO60DRAFT_1699372 [Scenedesmus sp. NREL 46B-D3]